MIKKILLLAIGLVFLDSAAAAIVNRGTYSNNCASVCRATGAHSLTDVTIPALAAGGHAMIAYGYFESGQAPTSVTLNSQAATSVIVSNDDACCYHTALYYAPTPSSGSSLTLSWSNSTDYDDGMQVVITFYSGGDISSGTTSLIRSSAEHAGNSVATTSTLTAQSGDLIAMSYAADPGTHTFNNGASAVSVGTNPVTGIVEYAPSGNTTMSLTTSSLFPAIAAAVMKAAGSGPTGLSRITQQQQAANDENFRPSVLSNMRTVR